MRRNNVAYLYLYVNKECEGVVYFNRLVAWAFREITINMPGSYVELVFIRRTLFFFSSEVVFLFLVGSRVRPSAQDSGV
ncbi:hypothetical protein GCM10010918_01670 [Paenibacillus radicis (ex Gao et al. 2016)]|uniref:Uncharacterized protein n=1 Tax=Paenibacillus radicis (ex Gao et al. 2016) TaxID=1737354 RepID=A0A917GNG5_9BACL|nr:hypothetical protein GCM10010918_01670 [Paenibacillus radicis (ex Gao et al. 2016)]